MTERNLFWYEIAFYNTELSICKKFLISFIFNMGGGYLRNLITVTYQRMATDKHQNVVLTILNNIHK